MKMLDLFCGAGGAGMGYHRAGFSVTGVDVNPQPNYPFGFMRIDALSLNYEELLSFDVIHASPPCQAYSKASAVARKQGKLYPELIEPTRRMLAATGKPYIIENVTGAPIRPDLSLCGTMFGLGVIRRRYFETNILGLKCELQTNISGSVKEGDYFTVAGGGKGSLIQWKQAMGIDWMKTRSEVKESIPPAYTEWIGHEVIRVLRSGEMRLRSASKRDRILEPVLSTVKLAYQKRLI